MAQIFFSKHGEKRNEEKGKGCIKSGSNTSGTG